ncbi:hypothetical protein [Paracoccus sp. (in: a-proteobacteria)]|uniref:hypothetical protein n=1 Tax=Paracoccus sp. TaxID=267 RepID=UPI0026DF13D6|nr:hypothetical protein [Paracoccus sp. (in: a-proteobacteria)]MDO5648115.1 hypothetical protein [Paracoccus sp. (in: a-proteobacteria)]
MLNLENGWRGAGARTVGALIQAIKEGFNEIREACREKRALKLWVKSLPKDYLDELIAKIALPEWMFDERDAYQGFDAEAAREAPKIYQAYVDAEMADLPERKRKALAQAVYQRRVIQWLEATAEQRGADWRMQYEAEQAAKFAAGEARRAAARAVPDALSPEGLRAEAERTFRDTGIYGLPSHGGKILTRNQRVQLGLPGGPERVGGTGLLDAGR